MALRKIDLMHKEFGYGSGECRDCPHLLKSTYDKTYYKCAVYGMSASEGTDWKISNWACGLKDKDKDEVKKYRPIVELVRHGTKHADAPVSGQISIFNEEGRIEQAGTQKQG